MGKKVNLVGQKFGKLTVISEIEKRSRNGIMWKCKCECGNVKDVLGSNLRNQLTKSCGCVKKEYFESRIVNIKNKRFGRITVK